MRSINSQALLMILFSAGLIGSLAAKPPKKPSVGQFSALIARSPFTIKPAVQGPVTASPLERDWMLGSIRPSGNGWSVTLINKKDRKDRVRLIPGFSTGEFQLIEVQQDTQSFENSKVKIRKGSQTGWITYDEKLVKVKPSVAAKTPTKKSSNNSRRTGPPIPGRTKNTKPSARVRHVPRSGR